MQTSFYVTTTELDHPEREHNYRLPQGETIPEDQKIKTQRPAGEFKFADLVSFGYSRR